jgi:hypothetical protein
MNIQKKRDTDGRMILRDNFDAIFTNIQTLIFGEDAESYW